MSKHEELIKSLRMAGCNIPIADLAADALEAQAREIEGLQAQLDATAKSAFEAMPHDIPRRMKRKICVETGWSMSMVSRAYIEFRAAFTGEKYTANEDLDAARAEIEGLRKDAERYRWLRAEHERVDPVCHLTWKLGLRRDETNWVNTARLDESIDAAKGAPHG